ncbi:glycosyl hydrolase [Plesiomonas shigelloides]|nr:glycosyl hydrolase [Plesiomonas shigelloides]
MRCNTVVSPITRNIVMLSISLRCLLGAGSLLVPARKIPSRLVLRLLFLRPSAWRTAALLISGVLAAQPLYAQPIQPAISLPATGGQYLIEPQTLAISWLPDAAGQDAPVAYPVSDGGEKRAVSALQVQATRAQWQWPQAVVEARSEDGDVRLTVRARSLEAAPITLRWFSLAPQVSELALPFSEGMRVPVADRRWATFLQQSYDGSNTTQDLKLPFWTLRLSLANLGAANIGVANTAATATTTTHATTTSANAALYTSLILLTPFDNQLAFAARQNGNVAMQAEHRFDPLSPAPELTVLLHTGNDWLSGARRYRQWRQEVGLREPLSAKIAANPEAAKLIGASHVYLFGRDLIDVDDVTNWPALATFLLNDPQLARHLDAATRRELTPLASAKEPANRYTRRVLVEALNQALNAQFPVSLPRAEGAQSIAAQFQAAQQRRAYLRQHASAWLLADNLWGSGLSQGMLTTLQQAGLTHLWLGLDNWMPAFYQPQVVEAGRAAGYLLASYDSYGTAIPAGVNDSWLSAQIPDAWRQRCGIIQADGQPLPGFRGKGSYLNPGCIRPYAEARVKALMQTGKFNSLFMDVDAAGMALNDYRSRSALASKQKTKDKSQEQSKPNALPPLDQHASVMAADFNARLQWLASQGWVTGSEDGNAVTVRGLAFAHGLETVGFGWGDPEMTKNRQSPYFLGAWYPDNQPDFFFRPAQVKAPYQQLLFAPQYRLPLYQAVFHDEIISSHHWHSDSLKFSDVQGWRDITAMLYNTPPMVHLNRNTAKAGSTRIKALQHYQHAFLPLHRQLWDKQLEQLRWLTADGLVQQTRFSDGSLITANFSQQAQQVAGNTLPPLSVLAQLASGEQIRWQSQAVKGKSQ